MGKLRQVPPGRIAGVAHLVVGGQDEQDLWLLVAVVARESALRFVDEGRHGLWLLL